MDPTIPISSKHILVVDDNAQIRQVIVKYLQIENYITYQARDGQAALKSLNTIRPDLILSDINMPLMNGIELYKEVRKNPQWVTIPFIFLSSNDSPEDIRMGRDLGVEDYLTKPIDPDDLTHTINARLLRSAELEVAHIGQAYFETVKVLANAIEGRDKYTRGHVDRVTIYTTWLAEELNWPPDYMRVLEFGARLHDIGKIIVPDHILNKPGKLNGEEWELMKQHPTTGAKILRGISHLQAAMPYILYHHERWDGTGYPEGLKGRAIPLEARILAITDVYDALTTARPYHPARARNEVMQFIQMQSGRQFDPNLAPMFIDIMEKRGK
ncbi:MAG: response regulator [Chloroflexi bacterium]|nr:response regulator [Chloroflexota bacterium]